MYMDFMTKKRFHIMKHRGLVTAYTNSYLLCRKLCLLHFIFNLQAAAAFLSVE